MFKFQLGLLLIISLYSCQNSKKTSKIEGAEYLLGKWQAKIEDGILTENWKKVNDSVFVGESFFIKSKDSLHHEKMKLQQKGAFLTYTSQIKEQNNGMAISFMQLKNQDSTLVFENLKNDYPQKISYKKIDSNQMEIWVLGIENGKKSSSRFIFQRP